MPNITYHTGWPYYRGRLKFHDLRAIMSNTLYSKFAFLEQLLSLINNRNVDIAYSNRRKLLKISLQYIRHLKFGHKNATSAFYVYCSTRTGSEY